MKKFIILSSIVLSGCVALDKDPCVHIPVKQSKAVPTNEVVYGYTKEQFENMPSWCGGGKRNIIYDRSGRVIGYIR